MKLEDYSKYYVQGSDHYLIPKDEFVELFNEMTNWKEESIELNKQVEEYKATNGILSQELTKDKVLQQDHLTTCCGIPIGDIPKLITRQEEFIKYLEDEIERLKENNIYQPLQRTALITHEHDLQKYKEIIGVLDEKK